MKMRQDCLLLFLTVCVLLCPAAQVYCQPANDAFTNAVVLAGTSARTNGNILSCTAEPGEPAHAGSLAARSAWWRWIAPAEGCARILITNANTYTRQAVYTGDALSNLIPIASAAVRTNQSVAFDTVPGQTYHIAVDSLSTSAAWFAVDLSFSRVVLREPSNRNALFAPGTTELEAASTDPDWTLSAVEFRRNAKLLAAAMEAPFTTLLTNAAPGWQFVQVVATNTLGERRESVVYPLLFRPWNDDFLGATEIGSATTTGAFAGDLSYATAESGEPSHGTTAALSSLWWRWTPAYAGTATFRLPSQARPAALAIYDGSQLTNLVRLNYALTSTRPAFTIPITAGQTYHLAIDGASALISGVARWEFEERTLLLTQPSASDRLVAGQPTWLAAVNFESDHAIDQLEFVANDVVVGSASGPLYELPWTPLEPGAYRLQARGTNRLNQFRQTDLVIVSAYLPGDDFANALPLPGNLLEFSRRATNASATSEPGEPGTGPYAATHSLWWNWTPTWSGIASLTVLDTSGCQIPVAVRTGDALTNLVEVANNYLGSGLDFGSTLHFPAVAGTVYHVAVDNPQQLGDLVFDLTLRQYTLVLTPRSPPPWPAGKPVELEAVNYESNHPISQVEFLLDANLLGTTFADPHILNWTAPLAGEYPIWVRGTNSLGELRVSAPLPLSFAPPNDDFDHASVIPASTEIVRVEGSTTSATYEPGEPRPLGVAGMGSIWFVWTPPFSGTIFLSAEGSQSAPSVSVFSGSALTNLVLVKDPWTGAVPVTAGQSYYLAVDATWGNQGPVRITVYPPPPNDDFNHATLMAGFEGTFLGTNYSAGAESGEPVTDASSQGSVWWRWVSPATGDLRIDTSESYGMTIQTAVYTGNAVDALVGVGGPQVTSSRSIWGSGSWSPLVCRVRQGVTYHIRLSGGADPNSTSYSTSGVITASYSLTVLPNLPANDDFAHRTALEGHPLVIAGDITAASMEPDEPLPPSTAAGGKSVWWSYRVPEDGVLRLQVASLHGSRMVVAAWEGSTLTTLYHLGCGEVGSPLLLPVRAGQSLQISLDGIPWFGGEFTLALDCFAPPVNDAFERSRRLVGTNVVLAGTNYAASFQANEPACAPDAAGKTLWFSWMAPTTGRASISSGAYYFRAAAYTGATLAHLTRVQTVPYADFAFLGIKDTVYHLQFDTETGMTGEFRQELSIEPLLPAVNDAFDQALPLGGQYASTRGSLLGATSEPGEPQHLGSPTCGSVWWTWQAPFNGEFWWRTEGSLATNLLLGVYRGTAVEALTLVARSVQTVGFRAVGGETYRIAAVSVPGVISDVWLTVGGGLPSAAQAVPGNLLLNPSFENVGGDPGLYLTAWTLEPSGHNGYVGEPGAADGQNWIAIPGNTQLSQEIATVPGHTYRIRLATYGQVPNSWTETDVYFGDQVVGKVAYQTEPYDVLCYWHWGTFTATATASRTRLAVVNRSNFTGIDGLSVVSLDEPPQILTPPRSASAYAGAQATFLVGAIGPEPLAYQWLLGTNTLAGATNKVLLLNEVTSTNAGEYRVRVSNANGSVLSSSATLTVEQPDCPVVALQPWGDTVVAGQFHALTVIAQGTPPLSYQWFRDHLALPGMTNRTLVFTNINPNQAGSYAVEISNRAGSARSLAARLEVVEVSGPGVQFWLANWSPGPGPALDAPIHDVDGFTLLAGGAFRAQLYAGPSSDRLRPCGQAAGFLTGFLAGYIEPVVVHVPSVAPGTDAYLQVRVWDSATGATYEEARALGGRFGRSALLRVPTPTEETWLLPDGLESFHLQAGLPQFNVGRLEPAGRHPDGSLLWQLTGEPGFRYLVEKDRGDFHWQPLLQLTNLTGIVTFEDPAEGEHPVEFYRARILD